MFDHQDFFYKYYTYAGLKAVLETGTRLWSRPHSLPDPLNRQVKIKWEFGGFQEIMVAAVRKQDYPADKVLSIDYQKFLDKMMAGTLQPEKFVKDLKAAFNNEIQQLYQRTLVCCFSQNKHNLPMWACYADNHRGGLLKFGNLDKTNSPLLEARAVSYQNERLKCKLTKAIAAKDDRYIHEVLRHALLTKAQDWQHEGEWRVIQLEDTVTTPESVTATTEQLALGQKMIPFAREEVTAVYLGADMPEACREEITALVNERYPWAEIFQAHPQPKELTLDFECIKSWQQPLPLK